MTDTATPLQLVREYYALLEAGPERFDPDRLRALLVPDLAFVGPIAGHRMGREPFLLGVRGFVSAARGLTLHHLLAEGAIVAARYDAELAGGRVRFAEFFTVEMGQIASIELLFDSEEYRTRGGG